MVTGRASPGRGPGLAPQGCQQRGGSWPWRTWRGAARRAVWAGGIGRSPVEGLFTAARVMARERATSPWQTGVAGFDVVEVVAVVHHRGRRPVAAFGCDVATHVQPLQPAPLSRWKRATGSPRRVGRQQRQVGRAVVRSRASWSGFRQVVVRGRVLQPGPVAVGGAQQPLTGQRRKGRCAAFAQSRECGRVRVGQLQSAAKPGSSDSVQKVFSRGSSRCSCCATCLMRNCPATRRAGPARSC